MKLLKLKCHNCSADLEMDLDHLIVYCPYCGTKLMIDMEQMSELLIEKEKTKREEMKYDFEKQKMQQEAEQKDKSTSTKIVFSIIIGVIGFASLLGADGYFTPIGVIAVYAVAKIWSSSKRK